MRKGNGFRLKYLYLARDLLLKVFSFIREFLALSIPGKRMWPSRADYNERMAGIKTNYRIYLYLREEDIPFFICFFYLHSAIALVLL